MDKASRLKKLIVVIGLMLFSYLLGYSWGYGDAADSSAQSNAVTTPDETTKAQEYTPPTPEEILRLVNLEREKVGVAPLTMNESVQKSAQLKADDMYERNYFQHNVLGTEYTLTAEMAELVQPVCSASSENIRRNGDVNSSQAALDAWKASKPHYEAMINPDYTLTGIGVANDKIVQHFCIAY